MSPTCPLLCSPMFTTGDTEIFMMAIKKQSPMGTKVHNSIHVMPCRFSIWYIMRMKYIVENLLLCVCVSQDVPCREAAKHQPGVPDHWCQGNVLVLWPQTTQTGRTTVYPLTCAVKSEHRVTFPFHFPALHPSLNNSGPLNPQHKDTH